MADLYEFARRYTPNGSQTMSKMPNRYPANYPKTIESGKGCILTDTDGNEYIDYIAGLGPIILGYQSSVVDAAVHDQMRRGVIFSMPSPLEGLVAYRLHRLSPACEQWKFTKTGSDACSMALKIARAYTERDNVVVCGYHGWHDWYSIANDKKLGIPAHMADYINKVPYNDINSLKLLLNSKTACLMMEPQVFDNPDPGYLEQVKKLCNQVGCLLIFDETVTGFRYPGLLAQNFYHVMPDLTIIGKAMGNGYPMAAVGGRKEVMLTCERNSFFASTTFGGDCIGLAATTAVLDEIPTYIDDMVAYGKRLADIFDAAFQDKACTKGFPTRTSFSFPTTEHKALFWQEAAKHGVLFGYSNFIMAAHLEDGILEKTRTAIEEAAKIVLKHWNDPQSKIEGPLPVEIFRLLRK